MKKYFLKLSSLLWLQFSICLTASAQVEHSIIWLEKGSLHNWYSSLGCEIVEQNSPFSIYGLQYPSDQFRQDMQIAKGFWIGSKNWTDQNGKIYPIIVVHAGPRATSDGEFFPIVFESYAKFPTPIVTVNGRPTYDNYETISKIDLNQKADRILYNKVNTAIGLTIERRIYQFSQQYHSNYHIMEYVFTNTGNTNDNDVCELPNQTLQDLWFYWQFRYAINGQVSNCVNVSASLGYNSMNSASGPWYTSDSNFDSNYSSIRSQFVWHGYHPNALKPFIGSPNVSTYDNIGVPVWNPENSGGSVLSDDSNWRLGGSQFVGNVHIYADQSPLNNIDDPNQPATTNHHDSENPDYTFNQSINDSLRMEKEYIHMTNGHTQRHAYVIEPSGNFARSRANPSTGAANGYSHGNGYGPYTLKPGESIKIVWAEAAASLTWDEQVRIGSQYKEGLITTDQKNDSVFIVRDRLFQTFRSAIANYNSGMNIPQPPRPPSSFDVSSGSNKISISWTGSQDEGSPLFDGYRIYRTSTYDYGRYQCIFQCGGAAPNNTNIKYSVTVKHSFADSTVERGQQYYYYITSFSIPMPEDILTRTPSGILESHQFYTQTYTPVSLTRPSSSNMTDIRIAPNPYAINSNPNKHHFQNEPDKIAFFNIPQNCLIKIFTEIGELIREIHHNADNSEEYWNCATTYGQVVASGVYLVVFENRDTGERIFKKLVVIR